MELIIPCITGLASSAYLGVNASRYLTFLKFRQNKYINQYHLLQGRVTSSKHFKSLVDSHEVLFKDLSVSVGKDKTQTNYYPVKIGQTTTVMPHTHKFTKWYETHKEVQMVNEIHLHDKPIKLQFSNTFRWFATHVYDKEEKWKHDHQYYVDLFNKNGIKFHYGDRIKIKEYFIKNNEEISIFGEYKNGNKDFEVLFCGAEKDVHSQIRNQICQFSDIGISIAVFVLILSIIFGSGLIYDQYINTQKSNKLYVKRSQIS